MVAGTDFVNHTGIGFVRIPEIWSTWRRRFLPTGARRDGVHTNEDRSVTIKRAMMCFKTLHDLMQMVVCRFVMT